MKPKALAHKTLRSANVPGRDVTVKTVQIDSNPLVYEITAIVGEHVETQRHTVGAMGAGPVLTVHWLQTYLDGRRQAVCAAVALA